MYQVVEMKGDLEPWWFLEGWQEDIISTKEFENFMMPSSTIKTLVCHGRNLAKLYQP